MATQNVFDMVALWNAGGTTFDGIKMNVTATTHAAASQLLNLQTGGTQRVGVRAPHIALGADVTPFLNLVDIWNTSGAAVGIKYNVTDTASAAASLLLDLQRGGTSVFRVTKTDVRFNGQNTGFFADPNLYFLVDGTNQAVVTNGAQIRQRSSGAFGWTSGGVTDALDTILVRDAANTLAQRNGTTAQIARIYNTFTDVSNYERGHIGFESNQLYIRSEQAGSGTARNLQIIAASALHFAAGGNTSQWQMTASGGHLLATTDNTYDIGASGATRPRTGYFATSLVIGSSGPTINTNDFLGTRDVRMGAAGSLYWNGRNNITAPSDGVIYLANLAQTDFGRLQFGGTTSSFPALKRAATVLQARLADDSAFAPLQGNLRTQANAVAETPTATHTMIITDAGGTAYRVLCVV